MKVEYIDKAIYEIIDYIDFRNYREVRGMKELC